MPRWSEPLWEHERACYAFGRMRWWIGACVIVGLMGCGRKATRADCEAVIDKEVEIEHREKKLTDSLEKSQAEVRATLEKQIEQCVGKRGVTDATLACVKRAETREQIDTCLR